jgi:hypothetical protein
LDGERCVRVVYVVCVLQYGVVCVLGW